MPTIFFFFSSLMLLLLYTKHDKGSSSLCLERDTESMGESGFIDYAYYAVNTVFSGLLILECNLIVYN